MSNELTIRVADWRSRGRTERFRGRQIHVFEQEGEGTPLLLLHGFPSSSFDWQPLIDLLPGRPILAFDFLGFGLSDKPKDHVYSLMWQADLTEELVRRHFAEEAVLLVGHDMGTSVTTELFARDIRGRLGFNLTDALLFNGSMILEKASLTRSQKLLRSRFGPIAARLSSYRVFRREFGAVFSPGHPLSDEEAVDQWALICHNGGRSMGHQLIHYLEERARLTDRWHGAIRDWDGHLNLAWAELDPVATTAVLDSVLELRPDAPLERFPTLGHYPQIEDPGSIAGAITKAETSAT
ncbi:MAG: alpha/beta fold hydrolase [Solirubrobacterales bacterium]